MKSLIIGGAGFAGPYLARHLLALGHEVAVTKRSGERQTVSGAVGYELDILDKREVRKIYREVQPDYIFHLAAQSSVAVSWKDPALTVDVNIKGSVNVLDALRESGKRARMVLVGSGEEYGYVPLERLPVREGCSVMPGNIYAATKACQNMIGSIYARAYGLDVVMVRAFNHIGPNQPPLFAVADFCRQAAEIEAGRREAVLRVGNLDVKRDFTDVRDVVRAYALLAEMGQAGETYNIGSGHARSLWEVLQVILAQSESAIRIETDQQKFRPADVPVMEADIRKIHSKTGWEPEITLEQTIRETLDYWRRMMPA